MVHRPASIQWGSRKDYNGKRAFRRDAGFADGGRLPPGIINAANDCFCNSVLQALVATPLLEDFICFRNDSMDPSLSPALTNGRPIAGPAEVKWESGMQISDLFLQFMEIAYQARGADDGAYLNPRDLIRLLGSKFDQYLDFRQQDAHELLRHLLDAMYMEEMDIIKKRQPPLERKKTRGVSRASEHSRPPSRSAPGLGSLDPILDVPKLAPFPSSIFGGQLASVIVCNTCKHISHTYEDFMDLSIPIKTEEERKKSRLKLFAQMFSSSSTFQIPKPTTISPSADDRVPNGKANSDKRSEADMEGASRLGRSLSVKIRKSRERLAHGYPSRSTSRPTSVERSSTQVKRPRKQTPGEAAYLRALLRDEPIHASNPLALLRSASPSSSATRVSPASGDSSAKFGNGSGLLDCLRMFTAVEILDGENLFACHNCWKTENPLLAKRRRRHHSGSESSSSSSASSDDELSQSRRRPLPSPSLAVPGADFPRPSSAQARLSRPGAISEEEIEVISSSVVSEPPPRPEPIIIRSCPSMDDLHSNDAVANGISLTSTRNSIPFPNTASLSVPSVSNTPPSDMPPGEASVPRFRRFSSFHAEKLLSPHVSRESLASAPEIQRPITPLTLKIRSDGTVSDESVVDEAETTSVHPSESDGASLSSATRGAGAVPQRTVPNVAQPTRSVKIPKRSEQIVLRRAFKRYLISTPPPVLVIHLKRFQQTSKSLFAGSAKKIDDFISFPEYLDLRPFRAPRKERYGLDQRGRTPREGSAQYKKQHRLFSSRDEEEEPPTWYRLYAVVVHIGSMVSNRVTGRHSMD
ncbi:uncharacterized protein EI90DRAFT_2973823 [Cantharellus anzutake]|uniref:uncharacterized protein n=1 Tax=Cantharellus anzutake TaxID=1750568 RepID=UPI001902F9A6|nr:uncharacterized protein EI90DRAFT_2973823 [Cantharellus anzutake]KAF8329557.1 hypothetical protein EI90DRAFT_2973823 [Cantharellus anzutake]